MNKQIVRPLLDILIERKADDRLGRRVYSKPTHTDLYTREATLALLVVSTLLHRARTIADKEKQSREF